MFDLLVQLRRRKKEHTRLFLFFFLLNFDPRDALGVNDEVGAVLVVFVCCQFRKPPNLQRCAVSCASATSRSPSGHGALDRVMNQWE